MEVIDLMELDVITASTMVDTGTGGSGGDDDDDSLDFSGGFN